MGSGASTSKVKRLQPENGSGEVPSRNVTIKNGEFVRNANAPPVPKLTNSQANGYPTSSDLSSPINIDPNHLQLYEEQRQQVEKYITNLKMEISNLEIKNEDLLNEVKWLREEITNSREEPVTVANGDIKRPKNIGLSGDIKQMYLDLHKEHENMKSETSEYKTETDQKVVQLQKDLKETSDRFQAKIKFEQEMRERMEEVIRENLGEPYLFGVQNLMAHDSSASLSSSSSMEVKPLCRNYLPRGGRMSTPLDENNCIDSIEKPVRPPRSLDDINRITSNGHNGNNKQYNSYERPQTSSSLEQHARRYSKNGEGHNVGAERMLAMSKNKKNGKADHRRKSSEFNIQSESFIDGLSTEDLDISDPSIESFKEEEVTPRPSRLSTSAKSRDSGYLGDSQFYRPVRTNH